MATVGDLNALNIGQRFDVEVDGKKFSGKLNSVNHLKSGPTSISIGDRPWRLTGLTRSHEVNPVT